MRMPIVNLHLRQKTSREVEEEMRFHLDMLERKYAQEGMSIADAKAAASKRFGNLDKVKKQCVHISQRNSRLRRVLKTASIITALTGLSIHLLSSDLHITHIGDTLMIIAVTGRLLLYVRGLSSGPLPATEHTSITNAPEDAART